ncbi:MAG: immunity 49 family protein [Polyangiaceae bacterium]|nr:immunity 49 family protein [Polyangiaceae bacterium]
MLLIADVNSFWEILNAAVDYAVAGFRLWYTKGNVEVELCGRTLHIPGATPGLGATPRDWWLAVCCAKILRRPEAVASLLEYDHKNFKRIPGQRDDYQLALAAAALAFWTEGKDFEKRATKTEALSSPEKATISGPRLAKADTSIVAVMRSIRSGEQAAYTESAVASLKAFKAFWGAGKNKSAPDSYHDWFNIALAIEAELQGLKFEVESDYTPRWIIDGPPVGLLDHFKTLYHSPPKA